MTEAVGRLAPLPDAELAPWRRLDSRWVLIGVPVALVIWLSLVPLVFLLWQSFLTPQTASPVRYWLTPSHTTIVRSNGSKPKVMRSWPETVSMPTAASSNPTTIEIRVLCLASRPRPTNEQKVSR